MSKLTTHILDTSAGKPAHGVRIDLFIAGKTKKLRSFLTNGDGRCDAPLLEGDEFQIGAYQLLFHIGDYFDRAGLNLPDPKFIDVVAINFGIADKEAHYHVPLLVSPFGYSTYRGS